MTTPKPEGLSDESFTIDIMPTFTPADVQRVLDHYEELMPLARTKRDLVDLLILNACAMYVVEQAKKEES